jgi:hypothetical protein
MKELDSGRYTITNVKFRNCAVLTDSNLESEVISTFSEDNPGEKVGSFILHKRNTGSHILVVECWAT